LAKKLCFGLLCLLGLFSMVGLVGCGGSNEAVAPSEFAPPPTDDDEREG
jgi:hypothetical protein